MWGRLRVTGHPVGDSNPRPPSCMITCPHPHLAPPAANTPAAPNPKSTPVGRDLGRPVYHLHPGERGQGGGTPLNTRYTSHGRDHGLCDSLLNRSQQHRPPGVPWPSQGTCVCGADTARVKLQLRTTTTRLSGKHRAPSRKMTAATESFRYPWPGHQVKREEAEGHLGSSVG